MDKDTLKFLFEKLLESAQAYPVEVEAGISMASLTGISIIHRGGDVRTYDRNEVAEAMKLYHFLRRSIGHTFFDDQE